MYQDYFGKDASILRSKKLFLLDMDGTIYNENTLFEGVLTFLDNITKNGGKYIFITNNSSRSVTDYVTKVNKMGIKATTDNFFTSSMATVLYLKEKYPGQLVYAQGTRSLIRELEDSGIAVTTDVSDQAKVILIGFDTELDFDKMTKTCIMLNNDLPYIATNPDLVCPVSFGYVPDCGSMAISYRNATGKYPIFIGKPEPTMINLVMKDLGYTPQETLVIGDRLYTDIASGNNANVTTVCVLSGEATLKDLETTEFKPTFVFEHIKDVNKLIFD
ncbi:MAG: HAD-IIA family hydrolase [Erysipelotrichaceae bacterium]|nr:HAD-IIA family hydrolase [Erysipelotrichaceae bacterium]